MMPYTVQKYLTKYNEDSVKALNEKDDAKKLYHIKGVLTKINPNKIDKFFRLFKKLELTIEDIQKAEEFVFSWYEIPQSFVHDGAIEFSYYIKSKEDDYEFTHKGSASCYIDLGNPEYDDNNYNDYNDFRTNWYSTLNKTLKTTFPKIQQFYGYCIECGTPLTFRYFLNRDTICPPCQELLHTKEREKRAVVEEKSKLQKLKRLGTIKLPKNKSITTEKKPIFDVDHEFKKPSDLRKALHKTYKGYCQYCTFPEPLSVENSVVEHIIPRSIPIESVIENLYSEGFSEDSIDSFKQLLPPFHNSILNLTLSCYRHNGMKSNFILNPISLELILKRAEKKAVEVLVNHSELYSLKSSEGTANI